MFQIQCDSLRGLSTRYGKGKIPVSTWTQNLSGIFNSLKHSIVSSPLLERFDSSKPLFLQTDWSATGMNYILMQPDDRTEARSATYKLVNKGEWNFDLSSDSTRLIPVLLNNRSCTAIEKHYHGFVGEIVCGQWGINMKKRYLWGAHFYWLCDMKTTYKIMYYTGLIHILRRWC